MGKYVGENYEWAACSYHILVEVNFSSCKTIESHRSRSVRYCSFTIVVDVFVISEAFSAFPPDFWSFCHSEYRQRRHTTEAPKRSARSNSILDFVRRNDSILYSYILPSFFFVWLFLGLRRCANFGASEASTWWYQMNPHEMCVYIFIWKL